MTHLQTETLIREARLSPRPLAELAIEAYHGVAYWLTFSWPHIATFIQDRLDQTWIDEILMGLGVLWWSVRSPELLSSLRALTDCAFYGLGVEASKRGFKSMVRGIQEKTLREYSEVKE